MKKLIIAPAVALVLGILTIFGVEVTETAIEEVTTGIATIVAIVITALQPGLRK